MGIWSFIKKDVGYYGKVAKTEVRFHKTLWKILGFSSRNPSVERQPWSALDEATRKTRMQQERFVATALFVMLLLLTGFLVWSRDWEGFAVWLLFAALELRSQVVLRKLKGRG
jgi:hypothetical protein